MDWTAPAEGLLLRGLPSLSQNQSDDPRIGSGRDNATGGTISHVTSSGTNSASAASLGSTFVPVLVYGGVCLAIFFIFRRKCPRVYAPRTIPGIRRSPYEPVPSLPDGWFNWLKPFYKVDERFILNNCSLDGFFFLRYIRILATICFTGCLISWPVLLSVNATGGNRLSQLDLLTIGDINDATKFYAHVFISWLFFGFILFMICRECIYYVNLRQAYLMAPQHAHRLSARTVLFTCVPKRFLDEHRIRKLFGDSVKNVWIPHNTRKLQRLVDEREKAAVRLEKAEISLIKKANAARKKQAGAQVLPLPVSTPGSVPAHPAPIPSNASAGSSSSVASLSSSSSASPSSSSPSSSSAPSSPRASSSPSSPPPPAFPASPSVPPPPSRHSAEPSPQSASSLPPQSNLSPSTSVGTTNALQGVLSPGLIHEINEINQSAVQSENAADRAIRQEDIHLSEIGNVSETALSPSTTAVDSTPSAPVSDVTEDADRSNIQTTNNGGLSPQPKDVVVPGEGDDDDEKNYIHPYGFAPNLPDVRGSVAAQWLPAKDRPRHRPLANYGRSVDTIRWTRMRIKSLNQLIARARRRFRAGDGTPISAIFVEFDSQAAAQVACQVLTHHQPLHMSPRFIGIRPEDVIWSSLRMRWWERIIRRFAVMGIVAAAIIFWSIPAAFVGIVSNVGFLSSKVFFLHWIADLPSAITGVIQGLLPAVALSLLMAMVPAAMRVCARSAGIPSAPMVELYTQNAYFGFQVVQVFLITTLTSAASAAFTQILEDPLSIKDLLSKNLPKASNFYLSYITVQCLAGGALGLVHVLDLIRHTIIVRTIEHPRRSFELWQKLKRPHWGGIFPVYTNLGVIAISYTCIAPLILAFAAVGLCCTYQVYKYNLVYCYDSDTDSKGLHYPRALMHLMIGLYLAEICLIGLFSIQAAIGPVVLMVMFLIFTMLVHLSLNDAVSPLLYSLPRTLALEDKDLAAGHQDRLAAAADERAAASNSGNNNTGGLAAEYYDVEEGYGEEEDPEDALHTGPTTNRGADVDVDGAGDLVNIVKDWTREALKKKIKSEVKIITTDARSFSFKRYMSWSKKRGAATERVSQPVDAEADGSNPSQPPTKPNFLIRWLHPEMYEDYTYLRTLLPKDPPPIEYPNDYIRRGYWPPEMWKPIPTLWIPRDEAWVSRQEVAHTRQVVPISDQNAWLTPKGRVVADLNKSPLFVPQYLY
ncbi:DUF221 domain protein [Niveomyces insectorum RCEF 264]|uniref:DUF221 domain protein n=1 Tax=Niveomyces insectorum RCEF 264 TaxID=1081102 RepID=A0A162MF05_9HYPO|nr:DUF221 domain protein [Niveomyces insectorum RCEF 264]